MVAYKLIILFLISIEILCEVKRAKHSRDFLLPFLFPPADICECGVANDNQTRPHDKLRIIGGVKNNYHEFPWLAQIQYENKTVCGASIISDTFVITAAHCLQPGFEQKELKIVVGQYDMCSSNNEIVTLSVRRIFRHEDFSPESFYADIALLKLTMRLTFNKFISPICLPRAKNPKLNIQDLYYGRKGIVTGWGVTGKYILTLSCAPNKLSLPILPKRQCNASASSLFCAGYMDGLRDSCSGDSGGPFQIKNIYNRYELIGIVSSGVSCALPNYPGTYTDVLQFVEWILKHIFKSKFCI